MNQSEKENSFTIGTIKCYFPLKGFGFITREKGKDVFFFFQNVADESHIIEGAKVQFKLNKNETGKGPFATEIERIG
ncbi:retron Se72 family effector protein [Comamonas testosteroni]|uniref:retron Se72 family effector protein n=1 Tax=Comamonas testosteroni TaxID=285 RepID=UPI0015F96641|nr:retron Se72 family effector protein [Comamonas testosteroni]